MGIQINGNNDIISALDGSWTAEGASINTSGILTATTFKGNIVGTAATFTGPVTIGGTLTYEDVTNVDAVGIVTARTGLVSPYADIDDWIDVGNNIQLGNAGVITATTFKGGTFFGTDADINGDLDVDGHTNLDNVSVAGVTTFTDRVYLNGRVDLGNATGDIITPNGRFNHYILPYMDNYIHYQLGNSSYRWHRLNIGTGGINISGGGINAVGVVTATTFKLTDGSIVGGAMTAYNNSNHFNVTTFIAGYRAGEDIQKQNSDGNSSIGNILIGDKAGFKAQNSYDYNIAIGPYSHDNESTGSNSISIGRNANSNCNQGASNVIAIGYQTLQSFSNNGQNCVIGSSAATTLQSGTNNLVLGHNAQTSGTATSNEITLGDGNVTHFRIPGIGVTASSSKLTANNYDLSAISKSTTLTAAATAILVYDTRNDSDGGAWRKRTSHTSWYNETLGSSIRGTRREFPAVAVIVATFGNTAGATRKVYIYDGDDPEMPLWKVLDSSDSQWRSTEFSSLAAMNGQICLGSRSAEQSAYETRNRLDIFDFVADRIDSQGAAGSTSYYGRIDTLADLTNTKFAMNRTNAAGRGVYPIVNMQVYDVAITVLEGAPINQETGLSETTIAVGTLDGVSILSHFRNQASEINTEVGNNPAVFDLVGTGQGTGTKLGEKISITKDGFVAWSHQYATNICTIPHDDITTTYFNGLANFTGRISNGTSHTGQNFVWAMGGTIYSKLIDSRRAYTWSSDGLTLTYNTPGYVTNSSDRMCSIIRYNSLTGWMPGNCRLAILCSANTANLVNNDEEPSRELHFANHFTVTGNITKTVVATGAELVGYSGFSGSNYISRTVDGDFHYGTLDWYYMFWYKRSDTAQLQCISSYAYNNSGSISGEYISIYHRSQGDIQCVAYSSGNTFGYTRSNRDDDQWHHVAFVRRGNALETYDDGELYFTDEIDGDGDFSNSNASIRIGESHNAANDPYSGSLALFKSGLEPPSADIIRKIYDDERKLFEKNVKCTLIGSQNGIVDACYDSGTDTVHVGTSAGRSDFRGLVRINSTTTALTASISASNGLIAEE